MTQVGSYVKDLNGGKKENERKKKAYIDWARN